MQSPDLSIDFCGIRFYNPLILGSGGIGESLNRLIPYLENGASAVITRTLRKEVCKDRINNIEKSIYIEENKNYMLNCELNNTTPWCQYWNYKKLSKISQKGVVIISLSGRNIKDCVDLAMKFEQSKVRLFEINISCPHSALLYGNLNENKNHIYKLIRNLKSNIISPIIIKLRWSPYLSEISKIVEDAGADSISVTNSIGPGLDISIESGKPFLNIIGGSGGISGKAIFPLALNCVKIVTQSVKIPVIGIGGIATYKDVLKMIMVGASCIQIYTEAFLRGPSIFKKIKYDLLKYLSERNIKSLDEIRGISHKYL
jgi:dihydroorotate dehydrogenase subfamily 1